MLSRSLACLTVAITGVAVTALELAAARLVAPFFGSTLIVWGSAIGMVLAALALGYWLGGRLADARPARRVLALSICLAGVMAALIPIAYHPVATAVDGLATLLRLPIAVPVLAVMVLLFMAPLTVLGAVSPFVLRLSLVDLRQSGQWSGVLSGASTLGSLVGVFASAFAAIPLLGTRWTIGLCALILLILGLSLARTGRVVTALTIAIGLTAVAAGTHGPLLRRPGLLVERESPYQLIQVLARDESLFLITDAAKTAQSVRILGTPFSWNMYDAFGTLPFLVDRAGSDRKVLVIGLAGGVVPRLYEQALDRQFNFSITGVEIDPTMIEVARSTFGLGELRTQVVVDDARRFLRTTRERYDVIVVDAYVHELQIPPYLATREFFQAVADHLAPGGVVGMNVYVPPESRFYPKLLQTIADVFPSVSEGPFLPGANNNFVVAGDRIDFTRPLPTTAPEIDRYATGTLPHLARVDRTKASVYTDDRTDVELRLR